MKPKYELGFDINKSDNETPTHPLSLKITDNCLYRLVEKLFLLTESRPHILSGQTCLSSTSVLYFLFWMVPFSSTFLSLSISSYAVDFYHIIDKWTPPSLSPFVHSRLL